MPIDNWLILALIMIFSSVICCALIPMIIRLLNARQRYRRYRLDLRDIESTSPDTFRRSSITSDRQIKTKHRDSLLFSQIPFIDDETSV